MADSVLVQLRLPPDEADMLREAGRMGGRSLPGEIRHRMQLFVEGGSAEEQIAELQADVRERDREIQRLNGVIDGLKMALGVRK